MKLVRNNKEYREIYPYPQKFLRHHDYPTSYPCRCEVVDEEGGIGGPYKWVRKVYPKTKGKRHEKETQMS